MQGDLKDYSTTKELRFRTKEIQPGFLAFYDGDRIMLTGTRDEVYPFAFGYMASMLQEYENARTTT